MSIITKRVQTKRRSGKTNLKVKEAAIKGTTTKKSGSSSAFDLSFRMEQEFYAKRAKDSRLRGKNLESFLKLRKNELIGLLKRKGFSEEILSAFSKIKREDFMLEEARLYAYWNKAVPIGKKQTISQPTTIADMLKMLEAKKGQKVMEVGSGSGYVLALLAELVGNQKNVVGTEIIKELHEKARENLNKSGYSNVQIHNLNAVEKGLNGEEFDRIIVSCAAKSYPSEIAKLLKEGGRLVIPIGDEEGQALYLFEKKKGRLAEITRTYPIYSFVPMK